MDPAVTISIISASASIMLAVVTLVVQPVILARLKAAEVQRGQADKKLDEIHVLANDNLSKANTKIDTANAEITSLKALMMEMRSPTTGPAVQHSAPAAAPAPAHADNGTALTVKVMEQDIEANIKP